MRGLFGIGFVVFSILGCAPQRPAPNSAPPASIFQGIWLQKTDAHDLRTGALKSLCERRIGPYGELRNAREIVAGGNVLIYHLLETKTVIGVLFPDNHVELDPGYTSKNIQLRLERVGEENIAFVFTEAGIETKTEYVRSSYEEMLSYFNAQHGCGSK